MTPSYAIASVMAGPGADRTPASPSSTGRLQAPALVLGWTGNKIRALMTNGAGSARLEVEMAFCTVSSLGTRQPFIFIPQGS